MKKTVKNTRRNFITKAVLAVAGLAGIASITGCGSSNGDTTDITVLTEEQKYTLLFMYQEEKAARDIYILFSELYPAENTFAYIQLSEQRHMDSVEQLCVKYGVDISNVNEEDIGAFVLPEIQELYDTLTLQGEPSLIDALNVGVIIEETDITDLEAAKIGMPSDVVKVFDNLIEGSINHLDAFNYSISQQTI